uniref:Indole-3-acetate O-methyltransferase 1-like n=1 Tax=Nelumbo nucifera TaxID=4432 RepID=A0A822XFS6_NELNU|nr:TPA_asm: hypothetical protein HUJ06_021807 [Nelumbo nucifera]
MALQGDNVVVSARKLERMFSMKGGKGEASYANNSQAQAQHARSMLHLLEGALDSVQLESPETPFVVADLGCSCGGNTIYIMEVIIRHITKRFEAMGCEPPEFSAFFSDLPSNDFNTLFQLLPPLAIDGGSMEECLAAKGHRSYFAAGVPGSFYRRLFPARSVDVFHSAFSLHWLSQVPEIVMDKRSTAYNKGRVFIHGANEATANAYKKQFQTDLAGFLRCRALEMKRSGSMFLVCLGRTSVDPTDQGGAGLLFGTHFQDAWDDLVQEVCMFFPSVRAFCFCFTVKWTMDGRRTFHFTLQNSVFFFLLWLCLVPLLFLPQTFWVGECKFDQTLLHQSQDLKIGRGVKSGFKNSKIHNGCRYQYCIRCLDSTI